METKEITVLKGQVSKLENKANEITITTPEENASATELKAQLKDIGKTIKERKEAITKPLNVALKSARDLFAPLEAQFDAADEILGKKLLAYKQKVEAEARAEEARIAKKLEDERKKLEAEVAAGKISETKADQKLDQQLQKAEQKLDNVQRVDTTTQTAHGKVQFRKIPKMRVIDPSLFTESDGSIRRTDKTVIPNEYWILDTVKLRKDVVGGKVVEGAERYEEETV